jgi:hypothetical protein
MSVVRGEACLDSVYGPPATHEHSSPSLFHKVTLDTERTIISDADSLGRRKFRTSSNEDGNLESETGMWMVTQTIRDYQNSTLSYIVIFSDIPEQYLLRLEEDELPRLLVDSEVL